MTTTHRLFCDHSKYPMWFTSVKLLLEMRNCEMIVKHGHIDFYNITGVAEGVGGA